MFAAALISYVVFAATVLAAPRGSGLAGRVARRAPGSHLSHPKQAVENPVNSNISNVQYSSNWAGAVYDESSGYFKAVTGTFTVPTPSAPNGGSGTYAASAWVGIDGDSCENAILQTGVDFTVSGGEVSYDAWYEWYPDYAYDFSGISISAGDEIKVTVTASSKTAGTAVIENVSTGKTVTKSISSSYSLCEENAEWIVEDFEEGSSLVNLADFGTVTFSGATATTSSGSIGPGSATIIDIEQNGQVLTSVSISSSSVVVKYV